MPPILAVNLFEGPWVIIVIAIIGAFVNWLTKRRQEKQAERESLPTTEPAKEKKELDWEKALRQLLGEEETPPPPPSPPPVPPVRRPPPPRLVRTEELQRRPGAMTAPPVVVTSVVREPTPVAPRVSTLPASVPPAGTVAEFARAHRTRFRQRKISPWRSPRYAREAFVASLVFGPPKGLES